ncbi:MAG: dephospho-CoA kinase, partial [Marmoricola sp.]
MMRVGLTGGIAMGKSTVSDLLRARGAVIIDADAIAREVVEPGTPGFEQVVAEFGEGILDANGAIDRPRLGTVVFNDEAARRRLEAIVHPLV